MINPFRVFFVGAIGVAILLLAGCGRVKEAAKMAKMTPPFTYESLGVRNSCFVESVHFYDVYRANNPEGGGGWVRVLQWGNEDGDYQISSGHVVAIYETEGKLCGYDVNLGFWPVAVPVGKQADLSEVGPEVFARYPQFRPVFARYRRDFEQEVPLKRPAFLFKNENSDVRDASRVASELGRFRPASAISFSYTDKGVGHESAAAVFVFEGRLCVYLPQGGTHVSSELVRVVHGFGPASAVIKKFYPDATGFSLLCGGF